MDIRPNHNNQTVLFKKKYSSFVEESREMYAMLLTVYRGKTSPGIHFGLSVCSRFLNFPLHKLKYFHERVIAIVAVTNMMLAKV